MTVFFFFLAAAAAFMAGFILGLFFGNTPKASANKSSVPYVTGEIERLNEEYRNFLSYDGTTQQ